MAIKGPHRILLLDDDPNDIFLAKRTISALRTDCVIEAAPDGHQAMERLRDGIPFALILLDLKLPGIDGIELLQFIRAQEQTRYIPVVMLTSSTMDEDVKKSYRAGANGYLYKVLDLSEFTECLKTTLHFWIDFNRSPS
jgi:two-component system response regulator